MKTKHSQFTVALRWALLSALLPLMAACSSPGPRPKPAPPSAPPPFAISRPPSISGETPAVILTSTLRDASKPQIVEVTVLPDRGMAIEQIRANIPGLGVVNLLDPSAESGGVMVPFANRIRGSYVANRDEIETSVDGRLVNLPANARGKGKKAEPHARGGLLQNREFKTSFDTSSEQAAVVGLLSAESFGDHWPGTADIAVTASLRQKAFSLAILVKNAGNETLPIAIGWRPAFAIPSGKRGQTRLRIPAGARLAVEGADRFPTGKLLNTSGTPYDFDRLQGKALRHLSLDDCFTRLDRDSEDRATAEIVDPKARYGLKLRMLTREIQALEVQAPADENYVALSPEYNLGDPLNPAWKDSGIDSGIVRLPPGETARYVVELEVFSPAR